MFRWQLISGVGTQTENKGFGQSTCLCSVHLADKKRATRSNVAGMRQFYVAYKDREDPIIQLGIGQLEMAYNNIPFKLSWTHYQVLMRIEDRNERDFYGNEAIRSNWNVNTLKRQFHSSLYESLVLYNRAIKMLCPYKL